jgi:hypothetical protein
MINVAGDIHYLVCMGVVESGSAQGESKIFGAIKLQPKKDADGRFVYTLAAVDGVLYINGQKIDNNHEITDFLKQVRPDGAFHVGVTVMAENGTEHSSVTLTRFGRTKATAAVPGGTTAPDVPPTLETDTQAPDDTREPPVPTDPTETQKPQEPQNTQGPQEIETPADPAPGQTLPPADPDTSADPTPDVTRPPADGDTDAEITVEDNMAQNTLDFFNKINFFDGCGASLSMSGLAILTAILSAAVLTLEKRD